MSDQRTLFSPAVVLQLLFVVVVLPFLPMLVSGRWDWWEAWAYAITAIVGFFASRLLAARRYPDLLAERVQSLQQPGKAVPWDRLLAPIVALGSAAILLLAGLDERFDWSGAFSLPAKVAALAILIASYALGTYALLSNRFFSGVVRIQSERGHQVVSEGPYRWIRHPGYAGTLLYYLAMPVLFDSWWAFIPALLLGGALLVRTRLEDMFLQDQLPGYRDYAQRVRYRLLPGVW